MLTVRCYQCPCEMDVTCSDRAVLEANRHAQSFGHNVGIYACRDDVPYQTGKCIGTVLKWRYRSA